MVWRRHGFITYRTLKHKKDAGISDIASVIGAVGGAAVVALFPAGSNRFDEYAIGLALGFFLFLVIFQVIAWVSNADRATQFLDDD